MNLKATIEVIRQSLKKPLVTAIVGFVLGLIIGLPILGWGLFPVKWTDAAPAHLREDVKLDVMSMMVDSYAHNQDSLLALNRWTEMGDDAQALLDQVQSKGVKAEDVNAFSALVGAPAQAEAVTAEEAQATEPAKPASSSNEVTVIVSSNQAEATEAASDVTLTEETAPTTKAKFKPLMLLGFLVLMLLLVGGALLYLLVLRKRPVNIAQPVAVSAASKRADMMQDVRETAPRAEVDHDTPIAQFMTTYVVGDDLYDDSFSVDSPTGEFLGECGVGITETIGVGEPKKVTALEIWLFDKNDIQTVTKVLLSEYSFNDPTVNQRVVSKGEPVLIEQDKVILLETATLQLEARIVDLAYGQSALPENSYFDRITMDLTIWPKA